MQFRTALALTLAAGLASACSSEPEGTDDAAVPEPVMTQNPVPTTAPDGSPLTPGSWNISENAEGTTAMFGEEATEADLALTCNRASGAVTLTLASGNAEADTYIIEAAGQAASLDMQPTGGELPQMTAEIEPSAPVFQGFMQENGVITISSADGSQTLRMPSASGIFRVFAACE